MKRTLATTHDPVDIVEPSFTHATTDQLNALGVSRSTIKRRLSGGEWKSYEAAPSDKRKRNRLVLISSLPVDLQLKWAQQNFLPENPAESVSTPNGESESVN